MECYYLTGELGLPTSAWCLIIVYLATACENRVMVRCFAKILTTTNITVNNVLIKQ